MYAGQVLMAGHRRSTVLQAKYRPERYKLYQSTEDKVTRESQAGKTEFNIMIDLHVIIYYQNKPFVKYFVQKYNVESFITNAWKVYPLREIIN